MSPSCAWVLPVLCLALGCADSENTASSADDGSAPVLPGAGGQPPSLTSPRLDGSIDSRAPIPTEAGERPRPDDANVGSLPEAGADADPPRPDYPAGEPGCGLAAAAFCETFDDIAA